MTEFDPVSRPSHYAEGRMLEPINPINPDWPVGAITGPDDPRAPEWPLYQMYEQRGLYGDPVVIIYTRVGNQLNAWALPVLDGELDKARAEAHRRLKESIENG